MSKVLWVYVSCFSMNLSLKAPRYPVAVLLFCCFDHPKLRRLWISACRGVCAFTLALRLWKKPAWPWSQPILWLLFNNFYLKDFQLVHFSGGAISSVPKLQHTQGQLSSSGTITFFSCLCTFKTFFQTFWDPKTPGECEPASSIRHGRIPNHFSLNCSNSSGQQWFHNSYSTEWNEGKMQIQYILTLFSLFPAQPPITQE